MLREEVSVLVVDDVNSMRVQIKELLKGVGFRKVFVAESGEQAKKLIEQDKYHLFMVDWQMAPTDGLEFLKYIRSHPDYKESAFIMVTAENTKEKVIEAVKSGVDDYLVKPVTPANIQSKVFGVLLKKKIL